MLTPTDTTFTTLEQHAGAPNTPVTVVADIQQAYFNAQQRNTPQDFTPLHTIQHSFGKVFCIQISQ